MAESGWSEFAGPRAGAEAFQATPFTRMARTHAVVVAGDTMVTIALAGTLFFSIDPSDARWRVFLYLGLTMAPFAIIAPLVGPALDRMPGGRRWMVVLSAGLRAVVVAFMARDVDSLLLFPEAFLYLVLSKGYHVAKSALIPTVVNSDEELVKANSRLSMLSGVVGAVAAVPAGLILQLGGSAGVLAVCSVVFMAGVVVALQLPKTLVAATPESEAEQVELRSAGVLLAASAMGLFRGMVGFLTFLLAFGMRTANFPVWQFGVVVAISGGAALGGAAVAPELRKHIPEEKIISVLLIVVSVAGLVAAWSRGLLGAIVMAAAVGVCAAAAKQAFDSIVQRDAPDANRGRSFARFESRFQIIWVIGAVTGVVAMPMWIGFLVIAGVGAFGFVSYAAGARDAEQAWARRLARAARRRIGLEDGAGADTLGGDDRPASLPPTIVTPTQNEWPQSTRRTPSDTALPPGVVTPPTVREVTAAASAAAGQPAAQINDEPMWRTDQTAPPGTKQGSSASSGRRPGPRDDTEVLAEPSSDEDATIVDDSWSQGPSDSPSG